MTRHVFVVPPEKKLSDLKELWKAIEHRRDPRTTHSYINDPHEEIKDGDLSVAGIISKATKETLIILWSLDQLRMRAKALRTALEAQRNVGVAIRVLNPYQYYDVRLEESLSTILASELFEERLRSEAKDLSIGQKVNQDIKEKLISARHLGKSLRQLSRDFGISTTTVRKYTKSVIPIKREKKEDTKKMHEVIFDLRNFSKLSLERPSRLFEIVGEYIKSKPNSGTRKNLFFDLEKFFIFMRGHEKNLTEIKQIKKIHGIKFFEWLSQQPFKVEYTNRIFISVRGLLKYAERNQYIDHNEFNDIELRPFQKSVIKAYSLTKDELNQFLLEAKKRIIRARSKEKRKNEERNFLGFFLMASSGLRVGSLLSIQKKDIRFFEDICELKVAAKRKDFFKITLDPSATAILKTYVNAHFLDEPDQAYILPGSPTDASYPTTDLILNNAIKRIKKRLNWPKTLKITTHSFRASYATLKYEATKNIREIQLQLGHADINQTAAYIKSKTPPTSAPWINLDKIIDGH